MKNRLKSGIFHAFFQQRGLIARRVAVLVGALTSSVCFAAAGDLDPTFATNGLHYFPDRIADQASRGFYFRTEKTRQVIALSRGGYLALGGIAVGPYSGTNNGPSPSFSLTSVGVLDTTFGQSGSLAGPSIKKRPYGSDAAYRYLGARELSDGRVLLVTDIATYCSSVGACARSNPGSDYGVQRLLPNGSLDSSYGTAGMFFAAMYTGNAAILADGTTIALGRTRYPLASQGGGGNPQYGDALDAIVIDTTGRPVNAVGARFRSQMLRCHPSGTGDAPLLQALPVVEVTSGDQVIYAYDSCMLKLNRDGTPDATFGTGGLSQIDNDGLALTRVLLRKDGSILAFSLLADGSSYRVTKRLANGAPDSTFGASGVVAKVSLPFTPFGMSSDDESDPYFTRSVPNSHGLPALDAQDRLLVAGYIADSGPNKQTNYIARFDSQLQLDKSFGSTGNGLAPVGNADLGLFVPLSAAVDASDRMVFAGYLRVNTTNQFTFLYSPAVIRMQADPPASSAGAGSGGCGTVGNARFDPTLWLLVALAMTALAVGQRRRLTLQPSRSRKL